MTEPRKPVNRIVPAPPYPLAQVANVPNLTQFVIV